MRPINAIAGRATRLTVRVPAIEGGERPILAGPRLRELGIGALALEYRPQGAPDPDTTAAVRSLLAGAGCEIGDPFDEHDGVGLVWAWRDGRSD